MKEKLTRISAYGIIEQEKKILLCRLSPIVEKHAGLWHLPGGGLNYGEEPQAAIIREVLEETGLTIAKIGKLHEVNSTLLEFETHFSHALRILYDAEVKPGKIVVEEGGSTDAVAWFFLEEAKALPKTTLGELGVSLWENKFLTAHELFVKRISAMTNEEKFQSLIDAGIYDKNGKLTPEFGG